MLRFVGCDVHKRTAVFTILLEDGTLFASYTVPVTREALPAFAERQLTRQDRLAMEATTNTWAVAGVLRPFVKEIIVSNPLKVRAIAEAKIKTDKVDSRVLAELLRCSYLPVVWQPDAETQRLRRLTHRRAALVSDRTRLKNRLHSILHHGLIPLPEFDLFSKRGIAWLRESPLPEEERQARDSDLRLLEQTELEIAELEQRLVREAWQDEKVRLVMSIPGIDYTVAQTCLAAIGDVARFANGKKLAAYLGLNPSTRQSGPHCYHGPITKQGNAHARWLLVQAAQHLGQYRGPLGQTMRRIIQRKNRSVAVVACARKLAVLLWHVLTSGEPFRYALPKSLEAKYSRLRVRATGRRRRGGVAKGTPRSARYGMGRTRTVPSLPQVLTKNDLPEIAPLARGEKIMLERKRLEGFYRELQTPSRIQANTRKTQPQESEEDAKSQLTQS
ncbi:MAG TPA: IS110 family transposase [Terriglobales bacterium]|nr:IS110 family transposase [Candidatus Acidoferrum sp.]HUL16015.1 IS110 family transposase [Terriglobales bacterium]